MRWLFPVGVVGSLVAALCCVGVLTPLLVTGLVAFGLGALTRSLDLIVLPALAIFLVLAFIGWRSRRGARPPITPQPVEKPAPAVRSAPSIRRFLVPRG